MESVTSWRRANVNEPSADNDNQSIESKNSAIDEEDFSKTSQGNSSFMCVNVSRIDYSHHELVEKR